MRMKLIVAFAVSGIMAASCQDAAKTEEVWIRNGNRNIYGVLSRPGRQKGKAPLLIVSHGFNGSYQWGMNYFPLLNEMGYQCYTFDFGCGSLGSKTDNNTMNMSVPDECSDLKAVVDHFRCRPDVDPDRIVLLGESQGGLITTLTASEMSDAVSAIILVFPAFCIPDNWSQRYPDVKDIPDTTWLWNVPLGKRFFQEIRNIDAFAVMEKFTKPVVIIQGDKDPIVPLEDSQRAVELYPDARIHVIPQVALVILGSIAHNVFL